jgi:TolB-like protein
MGASNWTSDEKPAPDGETCRVILSREASIRLGELTVSPALRRIAHDDGREEIVEPRVMQVLVALIRADGQILTRDDLLISCWHGVVVGEDAITRVVSRIRRLSDGIGDSEFTLETITKVGYRLIASNRKAASLPQDAPAVAVDATEPLLAVLAFDNLSDGEDMLWFADGVSEEILQTVACSADVKVIGRTSSFHYRGVDKVARRIAADLNATHLLDGSVRRSGSRVRISAHLIECAKETTLWSDRFDRDLSDIFALQDEIAATVAAALKVAFAQAGPSEAIDPAAYDLYLTAKRTRANELFFNVSTLDAAIKLLEQATDLAPTFARAWAALAHLRVSRLQHGEPVRPYPVMRIKVVEAAETALTLDPTLGFAYQVLSELEPLGAHLICEGLHRKALSIAPNDPQVLYEASGFSAGVGRIREALDYVKRAHDLDPMDSQAASHYAAMLDAIGRYSEARPLWDTFRAVWPNSELIIWNAIAGAANNADWDRFDDLVRSTRQGELLTRGVRRLVRFGENLRDPIPASVTESLDRIRDVIAVSGNAPLESLTSLYRLGFRQEVFDLIDQCSFAYFFDPGLRSPGGLSAAALFSIAHNKEMMHDHRFPRLCAKLGLCDYWVQTERWPDCAVFVPYNFRAECRRLTIA